VEVDSWQMLGNFEEFYLIKSFPVSYFTPYIVRDRNSDSLKLDCSMRVNCLVFVCMWVLLQTRVLMCQALSSLDRPALPRNWFCAAPTRANPLNPHNHPREKEDLARA